MTLPSAAILSTAQQFNPMAVLLPAILIAVGASTAKALGVFRRRSIVGPPRLDADEPLFALGSAMLLGLGAWLMGQAVFLTLPGTRLFPGISDPENRRLAVEVTADLLARVIAVSGILAMTGLLLRQPRRLGMTPGNVLPGLGRGMLGSLFVLPVMMLSLMALDGLMALFHHEQPYVHDLLKLLGSVGDFRLHVVLFLSIIVAAPISEELFFRGCLQTLLTTQFARRPRRGPSRARAHWRTAIIVGLLFLGMSPLWVVKLARGPRGLSPLAARWTSVIIVSLLFASVHPLWSAPAIFVLALCLGYAYERTGNLWVPIAIHALFNTAEVTIYLMQTK
ncbi:MAG: CPBP family intramembrane glutamic endopeptidase [Tepidisphaeraceae bacterium]|jgi:membrane protease YdiL (CAAX protease family)